MSYKLTEKEEKEARQLLEGTRGMKRGEILKWLSEIDLRQVILLCKILQCSVATVDSAILSSFRG